MTARPANEGVHVLLAAVALAIPALAAVPFPRDLTERVGALGGEPISLLSGRSRPFFGRFDRVG